MKEERAWIEEEFQELDLNDARLTRRFMSFCGGLCENISETINGSFLGAAEIKAAYRLLNNDKMRDEAILKPHIRKTEERMAGHDIVLHVQDTSEMSFNTRAPIEGMGKLRSEKDQGFFIHPTIAVTPERICLGVMQHKTFIREKILTKEERKVSKLKSIEDKESMRWVESFRMSDRVARENPDKTIINIADREGDFYEYMQECLNTQGEEQQIKGCANFIVRAKKNRTAFESVIEDVIRQPEEQINTESTMSDSKDSRKIINQVKKTEPVGSITFKMPGNKKGRSSRSVTQIVRVKGVKIEPPIHLRDKNKPIQVNVVVCTESNPPQGQEAIEWMLFTSLPIDKAISAIEIVKFYLCRWSIELLFKILKSGCKIEELQFESYKKYQKCLSVYLIIAWRILMLTMIGRAHPSLPCSILYDTAEWKAACMIRNKKIPGAPPSLQEMTLIVASFAGFKKTKSGGDPGIQTMWTGLQKLANYVEALEIAGAI